MVNVNELAQEASSLILFGNPLREDYRVNRCCGRRPTGAGGVTVDGPPNKINDLASRASSFMLTIIHPGFSTGHFFATVQGLG